jgi:5-methylcytosine-specific restriction protein A
MKAWNKRNDHGRLRGRAAQERRKRILSANPLCVRCEERGITRLAEELDHHIPLSRGGSDTDDNLVPLCRRCHELKTAQDRGYRVRRRVGIDGYPVDDE